MLVNPIALVVKMAKNQYWQWIPTSFREEATNALGARISVSPFTGANRCTERRTRDAFQAAVPWLHNE
jgi:hypothetical protein